MGPTRKTLESTWFIAALCAALVLVVMLGGWLIYMRANPVRRWYDDGAKSQVRPWPIHARFATPEGRPIAGIVLSVRAQLYNPKFLYGGANAPWRWESFTLTSGPDGTVDMDLSAGHAGLDGMTLTGYHFENPRDGQLMGLMYQGTKANPVQVVLVPDAAATKETTRP